MSRNRNRGPKNQGRAAQRRKEAGHALPGTRPGVEGKKSMSKALGPKAQKAVRQAAQLSKAGDHAGAAKIFHKVGEHLKEEGKHGLASRALLRCARSLHKAGKGDRADTVLAAAIEQAKASPNKKQAMGHFQELVKKLRRNGNDEAAERIKSQVMEAMGGKMERKRQRRGAKQD